MFNLVGFQTKMTHPEQERVFRMIPGLEHATFARLGSIHRNTYLDAPRLLDKFSRARSHPHVFFAGQITGVEGYIESTASGLAVGIMAAFLAAGLPVEPPPAVTAIGALLKHTQDDQSKKYEPMNVNFGIVEPLPGRTPKHRKKEALMERSLAAIEEWKALVERLGTEAAV
jgi:methylenetetrahydrofolate--tRNA-(uracil-5-)-methyltransferase